MSERYRPLPVCEPYRQGETAVDHGARVLTFLLQTDCTATLSELELERAEIAAKYAIVARGISVPAADRLSDMRHVIAGALRIRARIESEQPTAANGGQLQQGAIGPQGGDREPLQPTPKQNPPASDRLQVPRYEPARTDSIAF